MDAAGPEAVSAPAAHLPEIPIYFVLVSPHPGRHAELLRLLQRKIVGPLIGRRILSEFRVLTVTPPSFSDNSPTVVVFELVVPFPWPVTSWDVEEWQRRLGNDVRLVVAPASTPQRAEAWDAHRARSALTRAMVLPPTRLARPAPAPKPVGASWIAACVDSRKNEEQDLPVALRPEPDLPPPSLSIVDASSGHRVPTQPRSTLLSPRMAQELSQHLPDVIRWRHAWRLVYSPRFHGVSMQTFHRALEDEGPSLLILQDHNGRAFGGFAPVPWHASDRYFGDGETFVFRLRDPLPKPVVPLIDQARLLELVEGGNTAHGPQGGGGLRRSDGKIAEEAMQRAVELLSEWHLRVRAEAERADRAAVEGNSVTSMTEALGELLGHSGTGAGSGDDGGRPPRDAAASMQRRRRAQLQHCYTAPPGAVAGARVRAGSGSDSGSSSGGCMALDDDREDLEPAGDAGLEVFHWSGEDPFFLFSDMECLAFGGGSSFALYVESDLLHGMSEESSTFQSGMLSSEKDFIIANLECWVFDDPSKVA